MDKKYFYTLWTMSLFFSWFLAFPYFGSVLAFTSQSIAVDDNQIALVFIVSHALGFLAGGLVIKKISLWKKLILSSILVLIPLNSSLLLLPPNLWMPFTALIGFASSFYILGWSVVFSSFPTLEKIKLYAHALIIANLIVLVISSLTFILDTKVILLLNIFPLLIALVLSILRIPEIKIELLPKRVQTGDFPVNFIFILFLVLFLLHFSFGFIFALFDGSFPIMESKLFALDYYGYIPYLFTCLIVLKFASLVNLRYMPQLSISLFGLAFVFIILFQNQSRGFYLTASMIEVAVVVTSVFVWVIQGELSRAYASPYLFFGLGLFTTLLAVFFGNIFGRSMLIYGDVFLVPTILYAVAAIFITMITVPWLIDKISAKISDDTIKEINYAIAPSVENNITIIYEKAGLTEREKQIATLLCQGHINKIIAERLFISENTLKTHLRSIYRKFNVRSKSALIAHLAARALHSYKINPPY